MSIAQDPIEDPYIHSCSTSSPSAGESTIQESNMSHSDHIDDGTPPFSTDSTLHNTTHSSFDSENEKTAYNGPSAIHVVMLRVSNESSARPMPQAAFFNRDKALAFATRILLQWCDAHYNDYIWKGPESLRNGLMERYAAYHAQTGKQLAVADVIKVSIFDGKETEAVANREASSEEDVEEEEDDDDEQQHKEPFGEGPQEEDFEETFSEDHDESGAVKTYSTQLGNQEIDLDELHEEPTETLPKVYTMQAAAEYAMDLVVERASREKSETMSQGRHRGAWREDYEMRVFGGPTE